MSRDAKITAVFGGGRQTFRLGIAELDELEEVTGHGYRVIYTRIKTGAYTGRELRETLRLGLIGGGLKPHPALALVERYAAPGYMAEAEAPAAALLLAAAVGSIDDDPGEDAGDDAGETTGKVSAPAPSPMAEPTGAQSTA